MKTTLDRCCGCFSARKRDPLRYAAEYDGREKDEQPHRLSKGMAENVIFSILNYTHFDLLNQLSFFLHMISIQRLEFFCWKCQIKSLKNLLGSISRAQR